MAIAPQMVAKLIELACGPHGDVYWTQNADKTGEAKCDACGIRRPIVYSSYLQWCQSCWPVAAPYNQDTQPTDWAQRREGQERAYGWSPKEEPER